MQDQSKLKDVEEVLARLDQSWQEIVHLLQDGQDKPPTKRLEPGESASQDAGCDHQEANGPLSFLDGDQPGIRHSFPDHQSLENVNTGAAPCNSAPPPKLAESSLEQLSLKGRKQKVFNISILGLLVVILGGLAFLIVQTQLGHGRLDTGMLIIRGKDGAQRARLSELDGQLSLCLLDNNGKTRVRAFFDSSGKLVICRLDEMLQNPAEIKMGAGGEPLLRQAKEPASPSAAGSQAAPRYDQKVAPAGDTASETAGPQTQAAVSAPPETPAQEGGSKTPVPNQTIKYVGCKTSNKYHYPDCKWAKQILPKGMIGFKSVKEAKEKGYIPCPVCKPPSTDDPHSKEGE